MTNLTHADLTDLYTLIEAAVQEDDFITYASDREHYRELGARLAAITSELTAAGHVYQIYDADGSVSTVHDTLEEFTGELTDALTTQPDHTELRVSRWAVDANPGHVEAS